VNEEIIIEAIEEQAATGPETPNGAPAVKEEGEESAFFSTGHFSIHHQPQDDETFMGE
jgi:hypothetical protein